MSERLKQAIFNRMKPIDTPLGTYVIYKDGDREAARQFGSIYGVYLFLPTDGKSATYETMFNGIDCIFYDGAIFEYYKKVKDPYSFGRIEGADKLLWIATDLMKFYIELAAHNIVIHETALQEFLKEIGI